jgi:hypothetical protein
MIEAPKALGPASPSALLSALRSARAVADSQTYRLLGAMARVHQADARLRDERAKHDLGECALLLQRAQALLFGSRAQTDTPEPPNEDRGGVEQALHEFTSLNAAVQQASSQVDDLLTQAEQELANAEAKWGAAP